MPAYKANMPQPNKALNVAAGQTTAQLSASSDATEGRDYLERIIIVAASTAAPGAVTLFDGGQTILSHTFVPAGMVSLTAAYDIGLTARTTKGFNVTTGTSVSVIAIGCFG